jgi:hypothetical protein
MESCSSVRVPRRCVDIKRKCSYRDPASAVSIATFARAQSIRYRGLVLYRVTSSDNAIRAIPSGIRFLVNLEVFSVARNKIRVLPEELFACSNLTRLSIEENAISEIPESVARLTKLTLFTLHRAYACSHLNSIIECLFVRF